MIFREEFLSASAKPKEACYVNENPSIRAAAKILRSGRQEQASTHLIFESNSSKGQIFLALLNRRDYLIPLQIPLATQAKRLVCYTWRH